MKIRPRSVHERTRAPRVKSCAIVRPHPLKRGRLICDVDSRSYWDVLASAEALVRGVKLHEVEVQGSAAAVSFWRPSFQVALRKGGLSFAKVRPTSLVSTEDERG